MARKPNNCNQKKVTTKTMSKVKKLEHSRGNNRSSPPLPYKQPSSMRYVIVWLLLLLVARQFNMLIHCANNNKSIQRKAIAITTASKNVLINMPKQQRKVDEKKKNKNRKIKQIFVMQCYCAIDKTDEFLFSLLLIFLNAVAQWAVVQRNS